MRVLSIRNCIFIKEARMHVKKEDMIHVVRSRYNAC